MNMLITGASGFIGCRLMQPGFRAFVRHSVGFANEVLGDLNDLAALEEACLGIDTVVHCAGNAMVEASHDNQHIYDVNLLGTKNIFDAARRCGVKRFIFLSSVKAMASSGTTCVDESWSGAPMTHYGRSKRLAEEYILASGAEYDIHVVCLRLAMVYGQGMRSNNITRLAGLLKHRWFPYLPKTNNRRSLVHISDVIGAIQVVTASPESNGKTYIIADSTTYSTSELCDHIRDVLGLKVPFWTLPQRALRFSGRLGDVMSSATRSPFVINSDIVSRLLDSECYSPALIERELGWRAQTSLSDGLREALNIFGDK
jgi:UDP-glucose 4-epimerase